MPPSRSDRWQANFFAKKVRAVRFRLRSAAASGRAAAGSAADFFYGNGYFLRNIDFHAEALNRTDYICHFIQYVL